MDPRLLDYYNRELGYFRQLGAEFARRVPEGRRARLGMKGIEVADPYVERLLEGAAFLGARVQLKLDAEFPRFSQRLLEVVYPNYLAPTPSTAIVRSRRSSREATLATGSRCRAARRCAAAIAHGRADRLRVPHRARRHAVAARDHRGRATARAGGRCRSTACRSTGRRAAAIRLRLQAPAGRRAAAARDRPAAALPRRRRRRRVAAVRAHDRARVRHRRRAARRGRSRGTTLLPATSRARRRLRRGRGAAPVRARGVRGLPAAARVLRVPAALPVRRARRARARVRRHRGPDLRRRAAARPADAGARARRRHASSSRCTARRRSTCSRGAATACRSRPTCSSTTSCSTARGRSTSRSTRSARCSATAPNEQRAAGVPAVLRLGHRRRPQLAAATTRCAASRALLSEQGAPQRAAHRLRRQRGVPLARRPVEAPYRGDLRQLTVVALCTNRDLALLMPVGGPHRLHARELARRSSRSRAARPDAARSPRCAEREITWRLISHLSLNYLTLTDVDRQQGAAACAGCCELYAALADPSTRRQIEGVQGMALRPVTRRMPRPGPLVFGRGRRDRAHARRDGRSPARSRSCSAAVLDQFFARHAGINTFTETVVHVAAARRARALGAAARASGRRCERRAVARRRPARSRTAVDASHDAWLRRRDRSTRTATTCGTCCARSTRATPTCRRSAARRSPTSSRCASAQEPSLAFAPAQLARDRDARARRPAASRSSASACSARTARCRST